MDVYVMPASMVRRGLVAAAKDQMEVAPRAAAVADATFDPEAYTNKIKAAETDTKKTSEVTEALAGELKKQWATGTAMVPTFHSLI